MHEIPPPTAAAVEGVGEATPSAVTAAAVTAVGLVAIRSPGLAKVLADRRPEVPADVRRSNTRAGKQAAAGGAGRRIAPVVGALGTAVGSLQTSARQPQPARVCGLSAAAAAAAAHRAGSEVAARQRLGEAALAASAPVDCLVAAPAEAKAPGRPGRLVAGPVAAAAARAPLAGCQEAVPVAAVGAATPLAGPPVGEVDCPEGAAVHRPFASPAALAGRRLPGSAWNRWLRRPSSRRAFRLAGVLR